MCFFFNDTATTEIYTLSLHDALPIYDGAGDAPVGRPGGERGRLLLHPEAVPQRRAARDPAPRDRAPHPARRERSEEHTSELQSRQYLVCRLLLEKKKNPARAPPAHAI